MAIEDPATVCNGSLEISKGREAQMIRHMRHGSSPGLMAPQPILGSNRRESLATPSAGDRITGADFDIESIQPVGDRLWFGDEFGPYLIETDRTGRVLSVQETFVDGKLA